MKKYFFTCCIFFQAVIIDAQFNADEDPFLVRSLIHESIKTAEINAIGGNISFIGSRVADFRVEVYTRPDGSTRDDLSKQDIEKILKQEYDLNIVVKSNKLMVSVIRKKSGGTQPLSISFKVFIPENISSSLFTQGGNIMLKNVFGLQDFKTSGGNLYIDSVHGTVTGHTSGGNIMVNNSGGKIILESSGGDIMAEKISGVIDIQTTGGSVDGDNIDGELTAKTSSGNISFAQLTCSIDVSATGGDIDIKLNQLKKNGRIINSSGTINIEIPAAEHLDLDMTAYKIKTNDLRNFKGDISDKRIIGKLNGGGIPLFVKAGNGEIFFQQKNK